MSYLSSLLFVLFYGWPILALFVVFLVRDKHQVPGPAPSYDGPEQLGPM